MKNAARLIFGCVCLVAGVWLMTDGVSWGVTWEMIGGIILMSFSYIWVWVLAHKTRG